MSDRPAPPVPETPVGGTRSEDHTVLEYDFSEWDDEQRGALKLLLRLDEVPALWEDVSMLVVGRAWKDRVDVAVEQVEAGTPERADREATRDREPSNVPVMAGPGRRLLGWLVDWLILVTLVRLAAKVDSVFTNSFTIVAVFALYQVMATAFWGRTIGKLVVRTRVVRLDGVSPPGLRVAAIRWAVPAAALLFVFLGLVGFFLSWVWTFVVYGFVLAASRQGLHDRAARTIVVPSQPKQPGSANLPGRHG